MKEYFLLNWRSDDRQVSVSLAPCAPLRTLRSCGKVRSERRLWRNPKSHLLPRMPLHHHRHHPLAKAKTPLPAKARSHPLHPPVSGEPYSVSDDRKVIRDCTPCALSDTWIPSEDLADRIARLKSHGATSCCPTAGPSRRIGVTGPMIRAISRQSKAVEEIILETTYLAPLIEC